ncbi:MAG: NADP-dependent phosphogluconate dehydrogenase [Anaerolineales bacterium]
MKNLVDIGMIGLGTMGRNLVLNVADYGHSVVGHDRNPDQVKELEGESDRPEIMTADNIENLVAQLKIPHVLMILVPAGKPVDQVIQSLIPHLKVADIVIDGGNSHFRDTERRADSLKKDGIHYLGVGISGGEYGARHGPSIMPGGPEEAYKIVQPILEAVAAKVDGESCVTYLGPRSAGHYVKMVHNGIEYGFMQIITESYDLMKRGLGMSNEQIDAVMTAWNECNLSSYLMENTSEVFHEIDPKTGKPLVDVIIDEAQQNGAGRWASQDAMDVGIPVMTISTAVAMRNLSLEKEERVRASRLLSGPDHTFPGDNARYQADLYDAVYMAMILVFDQGMSLLHQASKIYDDGLDQAEIARIWCGGCIIRSALLTTIRQTHLDHPDLSNLLLDSRLGQEVDSRQEQLRNVVTLAAELGVPIPGLMSALAYYDATRSAWLPANLIQAQRDYFGAHRFQHVDSQGDFHNQWGKEQTS